jgi:polysaccharide export outer membrane protein
MQALLRRAVYIFTMLVVAGTDTREGAAAEYRLAAGDAIEVSVASNPELLQRRVMIEPDGDISVALLGTLKAAGLTLSELRSKIRAELAKKVVNQRTAGGAQLQTILPEDVSVAVAEYRPIYIKGDVAKPGEQAFRPNLTVRKAIAVAGGYETIRLRVFNPALTLADLKGEHDVLWAELAREQIRLVRLRAELDGVRQVQYDAASSYTIPVKMVSIIRQLEEQQFQARNKDYDDETRYLADAISRISLRIGLLRDQHEKEREGAQADAQDWDKLRGLFDKGATVSSRLMDARRASLLSATRALQTEAQLTQAEREREDLARQQRKLVNHRRLDIVAEMQGAELKVSNLRSRLQAANEKLMYTGGVKSRFGDVQLGVPEVTLIRDEGGVQQTLATEDTELRPGDAVEVVLRIEANETAAAD